MNKSTAASKEEGYQENKQKDIRSRPHNIHPAARQVHQLVPRIPAPVIQHPSRLVKARTGLQINLDRAAPRPDTQRPGLPLPHLHPRKHRHGHQKREADKVDAEIPARMDKRPVPAPRIIFRAAGAKPAAILAVGVPDAAREERELGEGPEDGEGQGDEGHGVNDEEVVVYGGEGVGWGDAGVVDMESCGEESEGGGAEGEEDEAGKDDAVGTGNRVEEIRELCHLEVIAGRFERRGRWGDGKMGRWKDGKMARWQDGKMRKVGIFQCKWDSRI